MFVPFVGFDGILASYSRPAPLDLCTEPLFLRAQLGGELLAEVLGLEDRSDLDLRLLFFYIADDREASTDDIVFESNSRCNQENLIEQPKNGVRALKSPVTTSRASERTC
jgi:hypothetical protein